MKNIDAPTPATPSDSIEILRLLRIIRRHLWAILGTPLLVGVLVYLWSSRLPPIYEATSSVLAARGDSNTNSIINTTLVNAPALPQGAVDKALHSKAVLSDIVSDLNKSTLSASDKQMLEQALLPEFRSNASRVLRISARLDAQLNGVYELTARAPSARAAEVLANTATTSLIAWDNQRSLSRLNRARNSLKLQLEVLERQIESSAENSVDQQTFIAARANVLQNLGQVEVLVKASTGVLSPLSGAETPRVPVSPRPLQNAALAAILAFFLSSTTYLGWETFRRRVENEDDLTEFNIPVLGRIPRLSAAQLKASFVSSVRSGQLYESVGFLRVGLEGRLKGQVQKLLISSSLVGEGKSSLTAALADNYARAGMRVLLIDFDLHRPTQQTLWKNLDQTTCTDLPGFEPGYAVSQTLQGALLEPRGAQAVSVFKNIDVLFAGPPQQSVTHIINNPLIPLLLERWGKSYDIVLLDTPPLMVVSDALTLARYTQGIILVVEYQRTTLNQIKSALKNARHSGNEVLGFVLNKLPRRNSEYYYYQDDVSKT